MVLEVLRGRGPSHGIPQCGGIRMGAVWSRSEACSPSSWFFLVFDPFWRVSGSGSWKIGFLVPRRVGWAKSHPDPGLVARVEVREVGY